MSSPSALERVGQACPEGALHGDSSGGSEPGLHSGLRFLGLDADSGAPFYSRFRPQGPPDVLGRKRRLRPGSAPENLEEAGWGVVFPSGVDPAIVEALRPLLERRREQAGALYRELTYLPREGPGAFLSRLRVGPGPVDPEILPYYLLIVGDPSQIPHGFQFRLEIQFAVGRLAFDSVEAHGHYAASVLRAEDARRDFEDDLLLFTVGHEGDPATDLARHGLATPVARSLRERLPGLAIRRTDGERATKAAFGLCLEEARAPITLSIGHSALFRPENARQRSCQGAIVCADWPGEGPAYSKHYFAASDLPDTADLKGRIFFLFGCHTAGTPRLDSFGPAGRGRRSNRRRLAETPFLARLPQALLGHPEGGALAVVAHVDRAFPRHDLGGHADDQRGCFEGLLHDLLRQKPVGLAMDSFASRHGELAARLSDLALDTGDGDWDEQGEASFEDLWTAYCDARSHIVLGDPAVRVHSPVASRLGDTA